ncbi:hypothetical protein XELAEV_18000253mg [Xenopus laevis]|uniref:Uncharacterized protein n=1 Tax=Xenopus laevis TaxID=8355 RepID=A0A974BP85_XENLA|nr:hypothetical protein XELAEV_18000253mg [Xenopus laevis]
MLHMHIMSKQGYALIMYICVPLHSCPLQEFLAGGPLQKSVWVLLACTFGVCVCGGDFHSSNYNIYIFTLELSLIIISQNSYHTHIMTNAAHCLANIFFRWEKTHRITGKRFLVGTISHQYIYTEVGSEPVNLI